MKALSPHSYPDEPGSGILAILGQVPKRWGRMDLLSRAAVVEIGRAIAAWQGKEQPARLDDTARVGVIAATRRGSLATDLAFGHSLTQGLEMASPTLFGYTLPNIALAEAASHYGLTGPVYSVFTGPGDDPLQLARREAGRWLQSSNFTAMLAGELDFQPSPSERLIAHFTWLS
jgi:3-oxoacyl-(acyl-carrier-protein) synthase